MEILGPVCAGALLQSDLHPNRSVCSHFPVVSMWSGEKHWQPQTFVCWRVRKRYNFSLIAKKKKSRGLQSRTDLGTSKQLVTSYFTACPWTIVLKVDFILIFKPAWLLHARLVISSYLLSFASAVSSSSAVIALLDVWDHTLFTKGNFKLVFAY